MSTRFSQFSGIKVNVVISFIGKGISVLCSFLLIPLILGYLDSTRYGIWLTITSLLQWIALFDFGFANGFRNRFVEAKARGDEELASQLVSTTYFSMTIVSIFVVTVFTAGYYLLDLSKFLNVPGEMANEVNFVIYAVCCLQGIKFTTDVINILITANQKIGIVNMVSAISSVLILFICYQVGFVVTPSLLLIALIISLTPLLLNVILSFYSFRKEYAGFSPKIRTIDLKLVPGLLNIGAQFFVIQIVGIVVYATANIIISNLFSPSEVTPYNIAIKYFSVTTVAFNIILGPFWSRFTHEYERNNTDWIKNAMKKLMLIWMSFSILTIAMLLSSNYIYGLWLKDKVYIPFNLSVAVMIFSILTNWNNIFAFFLNGVSKVRLQLVAGVIGGSLTIPLSLFLARNCNMGTFGIVCATLFAMLVGAILLPIQYYKIIKNRASGIWNK
jgi:O-antigen/teichoic acid export membrane protein